MGGLKIIGYTIMGSSDHLIVDFNTNTVIRKTLDGEELWQEIFYTPKQLQEWLEDHEKAGLIYG
tara:strand:- start:294 stop:485 length:192 start_codon:yes stop_codon:yes gene_type:complete